MARPPAPRRRGAPVVRRVLDVTLKELARAGLERLSVPAVARKAGVNKTSVYRRWPTKQALVRAALELSMQHVREVPDTGCLVDDLSELAKVVAAFITSPRGTGVLRIVFADGQSARAKALAQSMWQDAGGALPRVIIERAIARGELPPEADVELLLFTLAGALLHRVFVERGEVDAHYLERLLRLLTLGALTSSRGSPAR